MTWKDKLEIGLKDDAPYRRDNLPDFQVRTDIPQTAAGDPARSPEEPGARQAADSQAAGPLPVPLRQTRTRTATRRKKRHTR